MRPVGVFRSIGSNIAALLNSDRSGINRLSNFFEAIRWSKLAPIGNSNLVRLTILVPFFGSLILFNEQFEGLVNYSEEFLHDIGIPSDGPRSRDFTTSRLYFFYFGLTFLGFGAFLFALRCPEEIRDKPNMKDYIFSQESLHSAMITKNNFRFLLQAHHEIQEKNDESGWRLWRLTYPYETESAIYDLGREMHGSFEWYNEDTEPEKLAEEESTVPGKHSPKYFEQKERQDSARIMVGGDLEHHYISAVGYPNIDAMLFDLWSNPKVIWAFTMPFFDHSLKFVKDIAFVKFSILDNKRPLTRLLVAVFYTLGFLIIFIPTAETFLRLLGRVFS